MRKYIVECGLEGKVRGAINGANTHEDLDAYLNSDPRPYHHLVSCYRIINGDFQLIWERDKDVVLGPIKPRR